MATPTFDASTLSALTQKIQSDFKSGADPRRHTPKDKKGRADDNASVPPNLASKDVRSKQQISGPNGKKRKRETKDIIGGVKGPKTGISKHSNPKQSISSKANHDKHASKPTNPLSSMNTAKSLRKDKSSKPGQTKIDGPSGADLRTLVSELGGDDEDLKLIEDVGSESELEGEEQQDATALRQDIMSMIKELGIPQAQKSMEDSLDEHEDEDVSKDRDDHDEAQLPEESVDGEQLDLDQDGESVSDTSAAEPRLITQVKQALDALPERKRGNLKSLLVEPRSQWYTTPLPGIVVTEDGPSRANPGDLRKLHEYAKELLKKENEMYSAISKKSSSANQFYATIMSSGTLSDKISALTLSVQESPLHTMHPFESLVNLAKKRNRGQAVDTLGALKDLLGPCGLLPSDRRLRSFASQPGLRFLNEKETRSWTYGNALPRPLTEKHLLVWAYEDWLKSMYFEILKALEIWLNDEIVYTRGKALDYVFELLRDKPEQEANLLRLLINKLGDTDKKIASKTSYHILQIENAHPAMKPLIVSSLQSDLIFRPRQSNHAKYYGIITLNQTVLSTREENVARQVLDIYFSLFVDFLKTPKTDEASPAKEVSKINSKGDVQGGGSIPGKKARQKAAALARSAAAEEELREKMLSAVLTGVNRAMPYVDKSSDFFEKHLDTLFRITHSANFNTSVQALILIQQLSSAHQAASNRFYRTLYESLLDPRVLTSSKQALYLNLLYRALKADLNVKRVKAFVKRLLQVTAMQQPSFACAVIYLVRELEGIFPSLVALIDQAEADESDEEEVFRDVPEKGSSQDDNPTTEDMETKKSQRKRVYYDGRKRDPEHASAELTTLWELAPLLHHFHPSVALFASSLSKHDEMPSKPDLNINTLIHFLDRFVYRNPKKSATGLRGHSLMQPLAGSAEASGLLVTTSSIRSAAQLPVNSENFRNRQGESVGADEIFFHKYFNTIGKAPNKKRREKKADKGRRGDDDATSAAGDDEEEIWQALVDSRPEIEGDEDDNDSLGDLDEFEAAMQDDDEAGDGEDDVELGSFAEDIAAESDEIEEEGDDDEGSVFDFDDEDDILASDAELPESLGDDEKAEDSKGKKPNRRKMLKSLPLFASIDDYAEMLEDDEEE